MPRPAKFIGSLPPAARYVEEVMGTDPDRTWTYGEVRERLCAVHGKGPAWADFTAFRGLQYLRERGIIVKERRGAYRFASKSWFWFFELERRLLRAKDSLERARANAFVLDGRARGRFNVRIIMVSTRRRAGPRALAERALFGLTEYLADGPEGALIVAFPYRLKEGAGVGRGAKAPVRVSSAFRISDGRSAMAPRSKVWEGRRAAGEWAG